MLKTIFNYFHAIKSGWRLLGYLYLINGLRTPLYVVTTASFAYLLFFRNLISLVIFLFFLLLITIMYLLFKFNDEQIDETKNNLTRQNNSDVLLVLPENLKSSNARNKDFLSQNWSCSWINTLEQEIGYFSVLFSPIKKEDLKSRKLVIFSRECNFPSGIEAYVRKGGVVLIEKPEKEIFGIKIKRTNIQAHSITKPKLEMPLSTRIDDVDCHADLVDTDTFGLLLQQTDLFTI